MGTRIKINTAALGITWEKNKTYTVKVDQGFGIGPANLAERETVELENALTFTTNAYGPTLIVDVGSNIAPNVSYPTKNGSISGSEARLYFNRVIRKGTGTVKLYKASDDSLLHSFDINSEGTITDHTLTLNVGPYIDDVTNYYMLLDAGVVKDVDGFDSEAVTDKTYYNFQSSATYVLGFHSLSSDIILYSEDTAINPTNYAVITDYKYQDSTGYTLTISPKVAGERGYFSPLNAPFPNAITTMSVSYSAVTQSFDNVTKVLTLQGNRTDINSALATLSIIPAGNLQTNFDIRYEVTTPRGTKSAWEFLMAFDQPDVNITNMPSTLEFYNSMSYKLFLGNPPTITDNDPTGAQFTIRFVSSQGALFSLDYVNPLSDWSFTGTKAECNTALSNVLYHSIPGSATDTVQYIQVKSTDNSNSHTTTNYISMNAKTIGYSNNLMANLISASVDNGVITYELSNRSTAPYNVGDTITVSGFTRNLYDGSNLFAGGTITDITNTYIKMNDSIDYYNTSLGGVGSANPFSNFNPLFAKPRLITLNVSHLYSLSEQYRVTIDMGNSNYYKFIAYPQSVTPTTISFVDIFGYYGESFSFTGASILNSGTGGSTNLKLSLPGYSGLGYSQTGYGNEFIIEFSSAPGFTRFSNDPIQTSISSDTKFYARNRYERNGIYYWNIYPLSGSYPVNMAAQYGQTFSGKVGVHGTIEKVYFPDGRPTQTSSTGGDGLIDTCNTLGYTGSYNQAGTAMPKYYKVIKFNYPVGPDAYTIPSVAGTWVGWEYGVKYTMLGYSNYPDYNSKQGTCVGVINVSTTYNSSYLNGNYAVLEFDTNPDILGYWSVLANSPIKPTFTLADTSGVAFGPGLAYADSIDGYFKSADILYVTPYPEVDTELAKYDGRMKTPGWTGPGFDPGVLRDMSTITETKFHFRREYIQPIFKVGSTIKINGYTGINPNTEYTVTASTTKYIIVSVKLPSYGQSVSSQTQLGQTGWYYPDRLSGVTVSSTSSTPYNDWVFGHNSGSQPFQLSFDEYRYGKFLVIAVGGGGGNGSPKTVSAGVISAGGGGGGGGVVVSTLTPSAITVPVIIGKAGANKAVDSNSAGADGQNTVVDTIIAPAGYGGQAGTSASGGTGGNSGSGISGGISYGLYAGGGGGRTVGMPATSSGNGLGGSGGITQSSIIIRKADGTEITIPNAMGGSGANGTSTYTNNSNYIYNSGSNDEYFENSEVLYGYTTTFGNNLTPTWIGTSGILKEYNYRPYATGDHLSEATAGNQPTDIQYGNGGGRNGLARIIHIPYWSSFIIN